MKKFALKLLIGLLLIGSSTFYKIQPVKSELIYSVEQRIEGQDNYLDIYSFNISTGVKTIIGTYLYSETA